MNVHRGNGIKVHEAIVAPNGELRGTRCWFDVHYNNADRQLRETTAPVDCKTCLGTRPAPKLPLQAPASCPTHGTAKVHVVKTNKAGTYTQFTCGCKVWHQT